MNACFLKSINQDLFEIIQTHLREISAHLRKRISTQLFENKKEYSNSIKKDINNSFEKENISSIAEKKKNSATHSEKNTKPWKEKKKEKDSYENTKHSTSMTHFSSMKHLVQCDQINSNSINNRNITKTINFTTQCNTIQWNIKSTNASTTASSKWSTLFIYRFKLC